MADADAGANVISAQIEIACDDDRRWWAQWTRKDGVSIRKTYGARKTLLEAMPIILSDVLQGTEYPSIGMPTSEPIMYSEPKRRRTD